MNPKDTETSYEDLDELFDKTIDAKKIAIDTVASYEDIFDTEDYLLHANRLLERFREEFRAIIKSRINSEVTSVLNRLEKEQATMLSHQGTGYYDVKDPRIKCVPLKAIEAEKRRYE